MLEQLAADPWGRLVLHHLATGGMQSCYLFLLVTARLAGVFVIAPYGLTNLVPLSIRVGLAVLLSLIIAPTLSPMTPEDGHVTLIVHDSLPAAVIPETAIDLAGHLASEIGLGAFLGIGVIAVLSGLRLGGEWLDRHSGLGLGSVFNPEWTSGESACGSLVLLLGVAAFLSIEPIGGEWLLLRSLVESFHAIPVGSADCSMAPVELLSGVMQQSVVLGLRVAMPLVATMMLVDMTLAFAGRSSPHLLSSASLAMRAGVGLIVLALTMTTVPEVIATTMMSVLQCTSVGQK